MCLGIASGFFSSDFLTVILCTFSHTSIHTKMKRVILRISMTLSHKLSSHYFLVLGGKWLLIEIIPLFSLDLGFDGSLDGNHSPWKCFLQFASI
jgi:hypothetical protein